MTLKIDLLSPNAIFVRFKDEIQIWYLTLKSHDRLLCRPLKLKLFLPPFSHRNVCLEIPYASRKRNAVWKFAPLRTSDSEGHLPIRTFDSQDIWQSRYLTVKTFDIQDIWQSGHLTIGTFDSRDIWQSGHLTVRTFDNEDIWQWGHLTVRTFGSGDI